MLNLFPAMYDFFYYFLTARLLTVLSISISLSVVLDNEGLRFLRSSLRLLVLLLLLLLLAELLMLLLLLLLLLYDLLLLDLPLYRDLEL